VARPEDFIVVDFEEEWSGKPMAVNSVEKKEWIDRKGGIPTVRDR
jgi:hypothetical protein